MKKVLIVDDEREICLLVKHLLNKMGIETAMAHSLKEGLDKYEPTEHQLIFLDVNLPDGNGLDIIPTLKDKNSKIKIVVISAYDTHLDQEKAKELGVYKFIPKPFSKHTVTQLIEKIEPNHFTSPI